MIPILILLISTLIVGIIESIGRSRGSATDLYGLYLWGVRLLGKAITVIILINAVAVGLRLVGLLK